MVCIQWEPGWGDSKVPHQGYAHASGQHGPSGLQKCQAKPPSEPPQPAPAGLATLGLMTDRGVPGLVSGIPQWEGLPPTLSQGMSGVATSPLWTSTQPKLTFLLKFTNDLPVQVVTSTLFCVQYCRGHPGSGIPHRHGNVPAPRSPCIAYGPGDPP